MPVAIVTGASMGLGEAIARGLAAEGWSLVIDARGEAELARVASAVDAALQPGSRVVACPGDINDPTHREALVAAAAALGGLDLLINNASSLGPSPLPELARYPLDGLAGRPGDQSGRAPGLDPGGRTPPGIRRPAPRRQRHLRRGSRGLSRLGRVRRHQGRPRSPERGPVRREHGAGRCGRSTRATCAPGCIRRPSRARTSPTGRNRRAWCRPSSPSSHPTGRPAASASRRPSWPAPWSRHDPPAGNPGRRPRPAPPRPPWPPRPPPSTRSASGSPPGWRPARPRGSGHPARRRAAHGGPAGRGRP